MHIKFFTLAFLLSISNFIAQAQFVKQPIASTFNSTLWKLAVLPDNSMIVVGNSGSIFRKGVNCEIWETTLLPSGVTQGLRDISITPNGNIFVCGTNGRLLTSTDFGFTFQNVSTGVTTGLLATHFVDDSLGYIMGGGSGGNIIRQTTNGGATWTNVASMLSHSPFAVSFPTIDTGYVVGVGGMILKSVDGGNTWNVINAGVNGQPTLSDVTFLSPQYGFVAGQSGLLLRTFNGGNSWDTLSTQTSAALNGMLWIDSLTGYIAGNSGTVLQTIDGGNTFTALDLPVSGTQQALAVDLFGDVFVTGANAGIFKTTSERNTLFFEDFCSTTGNVVPFGWNHVLSSDTTKTWRFDHNTPQIVGAQYFNPPYAAADNLQFFNNSTADTLVFETRTFSLAATDTAFLSWFELVKSPNNNSTQHKIEVLNGSNWETIYEITPQFDFLLGPLSANTQPQTISLPLLSGNQNKLRFTYIGSGIDSSYWLFDDLRIALGKKEISLDSISVTKIGCNYGNAESIQVKLTNNGNVDANHLRLQLQLNQLDTVFLLSQVSLLPATSQWISIPGLYDFSDSITNLSVFLTENFDFDRTNDSLNFVFSSQGIALDLGPDTTLCFGDSLVLDAGNQIGNISWSGSSITGRFFTVTSAGTYIASVTDSNCTLSDTIVVQFQPAIGLDLGSDVQICPGDSVLLQGNISQAQNYLWVEAGVNTPTLWASNAGIYTLEVQVNQCATRDSVEVLLAPVPAIPTITQIGDTLFSTPENAYQWFFNTTLLPNDTLAFLLPTQDGNYTVEVSNSAGCSEISNPFQYLSTSVQNLDLNFELYPNPTKGLVNIKSAETIKMLTVRTLQGQILNQTNTIPAGSSMINLENYPDGLYLLQIELVSGVKSYKIMKY